MILVAIVFIGGILFVANNPELLDELDIDFDGDFDGFGGSGYCGEAMSWAEDNGYDPDDCACVEVAGPSDYQVPTALLDLGGGQYMMVGKEQGTWSAATQPISLTDSQVQQTCSELAES